MTREWVTLSEAAEWAQQRFESFGRSLSRKTVSRWALDGKVRAVQQGKRWFVQPASLMSFVKDQLSAADTDAVSVVIDNDDARVESTPVIVAPSREASAGSTNADDSGIEQIRATTQQRNARFLRDLKDGID